MPDEQLTIGVAQPPRGASDYPFLQGADGGEEALLDACIQYDPKQFKLPLKVTGVLGHIINATVRDRDNKPVISLSPMTLTATNTWGTFYTTRQYQQGDTLATIVTGSEQDTNHYTVVDAVLDPRACLPQLATVTRIRFFNGQKTTPEAETAFEDLVTVVGGTNVKLDVEGVAPRTASGDRLPMALTVAAIPGAGQGVNDPCREDQLLRTLNLVGPLNGNLFTAGDSCFRFDPTVVVLGQTAAVAKGQLRIQQDCLPCCDCQDYLSAYRAVDKLGRRLRDAAGSLGQTRDIYTQLIDKLVDQYENDWSKKLHINLTRADSCNVSLAVGYANNQPQLIDNVALRVAFSYQDDGGNWVPLTLSGTPSRADLYSNSTNIDLATVIIESISQLRIQIGSVGTGEIRSALFTVRTEHNGPIRACLTRVDHPDVPAACRGITAYCNAQVTG